MTISKKLSMAILLALGIQLSAGAFFGNVHQENALILNFAQDLRNQNNAQAQKVAQWLDEQVINGSEYHQKIIVILTNYDLTEQSKLILLSEVIAQQKSNNRKRLIGDVCGGIACMGAFGFLGWAMIQEIKNPRPIYRNPSISVTTTQRWYWPFPYMYTYSY